MEKGKIQTVTGPINSEKLGITLTHEHLYHKIPSITFHPRKPDPKYASLNSKPYSIQDLWWINFHPYSHIDNLKYDDDQTKIALLEEMMFYKKNSGSTIVENSTQSSGWSFIKDLSLKTNVNIIVGTGYYVQPGQPASVINLTIQEMYTQMSDDILKGIDGIKAGIIGEVGTSYPLYHFEKKSLQASGQLQEDLNVPVIIHPGRNKTSPEEVLRIFTEAGGKASKTVMSHLERTLFEDEDLIEFANNDCFMEFDLFGIETSYYEILDTIDMPSDAIRINRLKKLIDEGFLNRIVISQDIHTKHRLMRFGGHGFSHILLNTIPQMIRRGYTQEQINTILINNPAKWLIND